MRTIARRSLGWLPQQPAAAVGLVVGLALAWEGQRMLLEPVVQRRAIASYAVGVAVVLALDWASRRWGQPSSKSVSGRDAPTHDLGALEFSVARGWTVSAAISAGFLAWFLIRGRDLTAGYLDVAILWSFAIIALIVASVPWKPASPPTRASSGWVLARRIAVDLAIGLALGALALLLRATVLDRFPYAFGGDEGSLATVAVDVLEGTGRSPFVTALWYATPMMFMYLQAGSMALFGDSVAGIRVISAVLGAASVAATYLLTLRLFGRPTALVAAILLAFFHYHVHFSRLASSQIVDALTVVLAIYFLDRAMDEGRPLDFVLAGVVLGFSQYFYWGSRLLPAVAIGYGGLVIVKALFSPREVRGQAIRTALVRVRRGGWLVLGALLVFAPLLAHYMDYPADFYARINQVSIFASGWLERQMAITGKTAVELVANQIWRATLLPFHTSPQGWYFGEVPLIGFPMAIPTAIGLAMTTVGLLRRQYFGLAAAYWGAVIGLGLTEDPAQTQRFVIATPLLAIFGALGLVAIARVVLNLVKVYRPIVVAAAAAAVMVICGWNLQYYFGRPTELRIYGDTGTLLATQLAYRLRELGTSCTVYFLGPPRMYYYGQQALPFIARNARGVNVNEPWRADSQPPTLTGPAVFAALPERAHELATVRSWFPGGTTREFPSPNGVLMLTAYEVLVPPAAGQPTPTLPAEAS